MRIAYFDLVGGAAGDMLLAALIDAGADAPSLIAQLEGLGLGAKVHYSKEIRQFIHAGRIAVEAPHEHVHRHLPDVLNIIDGSSLPQAVKESAGQVFRALAKAEGAVHGIPPEQVHFHEVGAVDSIVDTVGVLLALHLLQVERVVSAPLPLARGTTQAAHGALPLPGPALLRLAADAQAPVEGRPGEGELVTPTAAALLTTQATAWGAYPSMTVERVGYGAGTRTNPEGTVPNVVRVVLGRAPADETPRGVVVLEANLDDQSPELTGYLSETLLAAGALDVFLTPAQMKKNRPGVLLTVLAEPTRAGPLEDLLLRESSTLGVRRHHVERSVLPREVVEVSTPHGAVRVKVATRPDGRKSAAPEYEDCARLAREQGVPLTEVYQAAVRASEHA